MTIIGTELSAMLQRMAHEGSFADPGAVLRGSLQRAQSVTLALEAGRAASALASLTSNTCEAVCTLR